jgi:hypothetical protein
MRRRVTSVPVPRLPLPRRRARVPAGQCATVAEVVERLRALEERYPPGGGVGAFNAMYCRVTEEIDERVAAGYFANPAFITRLDIVFAQLYLEQVEEPTDEMCAAWAPLFDEDSTGCLPVQFALAGMNAHIAHDLPIAVVRTCRQMGLTPDTRGVEEDYDAVNRVLAEVHEEVRQSLLDGDALVWDRRLSGVTNVIGSWSIARARDAAWLNANLLWDIDKISSLRRPFLAALAHTVGLTGQLLLTRPPDLNPFDDD